MNVSVVIAHLGDGVDEGTFAAWLKDEGESVQEGEAIAEVMTDKVNLEIEAPATGILVGRRVEDEDPVRVGQVIAEIEPSA